MYSMVMTHKESYRLFLNDDGTVRFRTSAEPRTHVKGELRGSPDNFDRLRTAVTGDDWRVGTKLAHKHNEAAPRHHHARDSPSR